MRMLRGVPAKLERAKPPTEDQTVIGAAIAPRKPFHRVSHRAMLEDGPFLAAFNAGIYEVTC